MTSSYKKFIHKLIIFSIAVALITTLMRFILPSSFLSPATPFLLLFFMGHTLLFHKMAMKVIENNIRKFTNFYMISTVAKLILFVVVIAVYALTFTSDAKAFTIWFFVFYALYTFFELSIILPYLRRNNKKP
jgi:hypothetical protein